MPRFEPIPEEIFQESGFTLLELMVAMGVFTIVIILVFANMISVVQSEGRVEAISTASSQIDNAFMQLDSEVRYASDINEPSDNGGDYFVEFQSDWTTSSLGFPQCTQLEYNTSAGTLQQRTWLPGKTTAPDNWQVLASGLSTTPNGNPFTLHTAAPDLTGSGPSQAPGGAQDTTATPWQLAMDLTAGAGNGPTAQTAQSDFTMTALNIDTTTDEGVCTP
jgi:prepilin-type N-terminal cleavage/methylation domain-containing protein